MIDLSGRVVLLTGASSGIGAETAAVLGQCGAMVIGHHRDGSDRAGAEAALAAVPADRKRLIGADFADSAAVDRLWSEALAWQGRIDVVVLNAGVIVWAGIDDSDEDWDRSWAVQLQVNTFAPARLMRAAVRSWRGQGSGVLVTLSSWNAQRGSTKPEQIAYAGSKAAIKAAAQTIARGYAKEGVLSYVITPGIVRTGMSLEFAALQGGEDKVTQTLAMGEWVPPEEIGWLVAFLATGKVRHLTGATLDVNGATYVR